MADPQDTSLDPLMQAMFENPPEDALGLRAMLDGFAAFMNADPPEVGALHDDVLVREVDGGRVTADVAVPKGAGPHPVLVYLHGGGWVAGSPRTHHKLGRRFAEAGYLVFNVDYRLGPEYPFPAAFDDCVHAIRWAAEQAAGYGGDASRLAVGGDSAGGNLTAAAVAALADAPDAPRVSATLLIYGMFDFANMPGVDAAVAPGVPPEVGERLVEAMVGGYLGDQRSDALLADPRVSPIHAAHKLPPSHVVCGTMDGLIAHAGEMCERLAAAGIPFERRDVENMPHGFVQMEFMPQARESIDAMVAFLRKHVG